MAGNSKSWQGIPERPYTSHDSYTGEDVLVGLSFINSSGVPTIPTALTYEVDSLTTNQNVIPSTAVASGLLALQMTLQLPGALMVNTRNYVGMEIFQLLVSATIPDTNAASGSIQKIALVIINLYNVATPSGVYGA